MLNDFVEIVFPDASCDPAVIEILVKLQLKVELFLFLAINLLFSQKLMDK